MVLLNYQIDHSAKFSYVDSNPSESVQLISCGKKRNSRSIVYMFPGNQDSKKRRCASCIEESAMLGEGADGDTKGGRQFPRVCKTFCKSASWSTRLVSQRDDPINFERLEPPPHSAERNDNILRETPIPLTPRSQQSCKARSSLPPLQPLSITRRCLEEWPKAGSDDIGEWPNPTTPGAKRNTGKINSPGIKLDLGSVQRNTLPTESLLKRDKFAFYSKECSRVAEHIYLGSDAVAKNREVLRENGITHVLNCVGFVCPEYFKSDLVYKTLWLQDSPSEDITSILYDVFDYFEEVRELNGRVLVHCCQGVSRSTSLVIAYLMWRKGQSFEDAFQYVKAARGITNPNMGFACQLLQCQKRVHAAPMSPSSLLRMYRMAPHSSYDSLHLVPKAVSKPGADALDSRGAFIIHIPSAIYVWIGRICDSVMEKKGKDAASQVVRYERAQGPIFIIEEGHETDEFWDALSKAPLLFDDYEKTENSVGKDVLGSFNSGKEDVDAARRVGVGNKRVESYDIDFELFRRAIIGGVVPPFSISGSGTETHLPARESGWGKLRRKFVSGSVKEFITASKATGNVAVSALSGYKDTQLLSPDPVISVSSYPSPSSLPPDSIISSKSSSPSPSSLSFTSSPCSSAWSVFSSSQSPSPVSNLSDPFVRSNRPFQIIAKPVSFPSKGSPFSLAQRRGGNSPYLELPALIDDPNLNSNGTPVDTYAPFGVTEEKCIRGNGDSEFLFEACDEVCHGVSQKEQKQFSESKETVQNKDIWPGKIYNGQNQLYISMLEASSPAQDISDLSSLDNESPHASTLKENNDHEWKCPILYEWPKIEKIDMFDADYLDSKAIFILLAPSKACGDAECSKVVYLWVGCNSVVEKEIVQVDGSIHRSQSRDIDWVQIGHDFLERMNLKRDIPIKVVRENEEPNDFWDNFIRG